MAGKGDIPANRMRAREEKLFGLWHGGDDPEAGLEGYDSSQRAEILEALMDGPGNGTIQTGLFPDDEPARRRR